MPRTVPGSGNSGHREKSGCNIAFIAIFVAAMTPHALITSLGGYRDLAVAVGRSPSRVHRWQDEGIPPHAWSAVVRAAKARGVLVTLDELATMKPGTREKMRRGRRKASPQEAA
jgi:hypothetical protein